MCCAMLISVARIVALSRRVRAEYEELAAVALPAQARQNLLPPHSAGNGRSLLINPLSLRLSFIDRDFTDAGLWQHYLLSLVNGICRLRGSLCIGYHFRKNG